MSLLDLDANTSLWEKTGIHEPRSIRVRDAETSSRMVKCKYHSYLSYILHPFHLIPSHITLSPHLSLTLIHLVPHAPFSHPVLSHPSHSLIITHTQSQKSQVYNTTFIRWTTHSPSGLSHKDITMARFCDEKAAECGELAPLLPQQQQQGGAEKDGKDGSETVRGLVSKVVTEGGDCCMPKKKEQTTTTTTDT